MKLRSIHLPGSPFTAPVFAGSNTAYCLQASTNLTGMVGDHACERAAAADVLSRAVLQSAIRAASGHGPDQHERHDDDDRVDLVE